MSFDEFLAEKRKEAAYKLVTPMLGEFLIMSLPTTGAEIPKSTILSGIEIAIFIDIWKLYFDNNLSDTEVVSLIEELGIMALGVSVLSFLTARLANGLLSEVLNFLPGVGWVFEGFLASLITLISGILWIRYCEALYIKKFIPGN